MEPKFNIRDEIEFTDGIILTVKDVIFAIPDDKDLAKQMLAKVKK